MADRKEYNAAWYRANRDRKLASDKVWRANNKDRRRHQFRAWHMKERGGAKYYYTRPETPICEACGFECGIGGMRGIQWDHNHTTKKFRGWLCPKCNRAIGLLGDSISKMKALIAYMEKFDGAND